MYIIHNVDDDEAIPHYYVGNTLVHIYNIIYVRVRTLHIKRSQTMVGGQRYDWSVRVRRLEGGDFAKLT